MDGVNIVLLEKVSNSTLHALFCTKVKRDPFDKAQSANVGKMSFHCLQGQRPIPFSVEQSQELMLH